MDKLHQQFIGTVLINIEDKQFCRFEAHDLTAELTADAAAAARHQNGLAGEVAGNFLRVQCDFLTGEEIGGVQLTERTLLGCACTHQLGVAEHLHGAVGGDAEVDDVVQAVPHMYLCIQYMLTEYCSAGFPHSEIHGSKPICGSP